MAFAKAEGLPLEALIETLGKGAGSSWYFVHRAPNMVRNEYLPGFRLRLHEKGTEGVVGGDFGEQRRVGRHGAGGLAVDDQIDQRGADLARVGLRPKETELAVDVADFDGEAGGDCHRRRQTAWSGARSSSAWRGPQDPAG